MCFGPVDDPAIKSIFAKPGKEWTRAERERVLSWLYEAPRLKRILVHIAHHLGQGTFHQEAEDTWQKFNFHWSDREKRAIWPFDGVINQYDPIKGKFQNYFCTALAQFCWREGDTIRKRRGIESPIPDREDEEGNPIEHELPDTSGAGDPPDALERAELRNKFLKDLEDCLRRLEEQNPLQARVFREYYFGDESIARIAEELDIKENHCRVLLHRARLALRRCLREKGWSV